MVININELIKAEQEHRAERDLYFLEESLANLKEAGRRRGAKIW